MISSWKNVSKDSNKASYYRKPGSDPKRFSNQSSQHEFSSNCLVCCKKHIQKCYSDCWVLHTHLQQCIMGETVYRSLVHRKKHKDTVLYFILNRHSCRVKDRTCAAAVDSSSMLPTGHCATHFVLRWALSPEGSRSHQALKSISRNTLTSRRTVTLQQEGGLLLSPHWPLVKLKGSALLQIMPHCKTTVIFCDEVVFHSVLFQWRDFFSFSSHFSEMAQNYGKRWYTCSNGREASSLVVWWLNMWTLRY